MATIYKTVAGNTAPPIIITCKRGTAVVDLTGCLVTVIIKSGSAITQAGKQAIITDAVSGKISYAPLATDFPAAGGYKCDVKVTYSDATVEILYDQLKVKARAPLS